MSDLYTNGISGVTGDYLLPPLPLATAAALAKGEQSDPRITTWLHGLWQQLHTPSLGLPMDVDPDDVGQAGWAIVFHSDEAASVRSALDPLIEHRRRLVPPDRTKVLEFRPGESWRKWLARHRVVAGSVEPWKIPYYLLLVGDPERIPYNVQSLLDIEYAVGRIAFDSADDYRRYAEAAVAYETATAPPHDQSVVFVGTRHDFDPATQLSADHLVRPLADGQAEEDGERPYPPVTDRWGFSTRKLWGDDATKANLLQALHSGPGGKPPALLFSATHGVGWPKGHQHQLTRQGALVCQDWPGIGGIDAPHYVAASDIQDNAVLRGLVLFCFACYGAGTPRRDSFLHAPGQPPPDIAERAFVSALPKRLLSHPNGPALALIGHVDRAWGYSIDPGGAGAQLLPFRNAVDRILSGVPVGSATKDFSERYAALSAELSGMLEEMSFQAEFSDSELAARWVQRNDAQNYTIVGDPAVRLRPGR
jgi:hypothetical protein